MQLAAPTVYARSATCARSATGALLCALLCALASFAALAPAGTARAADDDKLEEPADEPAATTPASDAEEPVEDIEDVEDVEVVSSSESVAGDDWYSDAYPGQDRIINIHTAETTRKQSFLMVFDHRTYQPFTSDDWFHDLLGFDSGNLRIGLELRYGILDTLDVGLKRLNGGPVPYDVYELDLKWRVLQTFMPDRKPTDFDFALRAGGTWFPQKNFKDSAGGYAQLLASGVVFNRWKIGFGALFHSNSSSEYKRVADDDWSFAVAHMSEIRVLEWLAFDLEVAYAVAGYAERGPWDTLSRQDALKSGDYEPTYPNVSLGTKFITNRHTFTIVITNNPFITADGIVANTARNYDDIVIGFTISRELSL